MSIKLKLVLMTALALLVLPSVAFASVGEINSNSPGAERILITSDGGLAVYSASGQIMPGFPVWSAGVFEGHPVTGDFDGTLGNEIAVVERKVSGDYYLHLYNNLGLEISSVILPGFASNTNLVSLYNYTLRKYTVIYSTATGEVKELTLNSGTWDNALIISGSGTKVFISTDNVKNKIYYAVAGGNEIKVYQRNVVWNLLRTIDLVGSINSQVVDDGNGVLWYLNNDKLYAYTTNGSLVDGFPVNLRIYAFDLVVGDLDKNNTGLEVGVKLMDGTLSLYDYQGSLLKDRFIKENFSYWQALSLEKEQGVFTYGLNNSLTIKSGVTINNSSVLNPFSGPLFTRAINFTSSTVEIDPRLIPPDQITGLTATSTVPLRVNLSWNNYIDNQGDFNRFEIYRSVDPNTLLAELTPIATSADVAMNSYEDSVTAGSYYYIVAVVDNDGNTTISGSGGLGQGGNWLGPVEVLTGLPPAVTNLTGVPMYRGVQLNWTTSTDPGVYDYYVEYKKKTDPSFKLAKGPTSTVPVAKIGGLTEYGSEYQFRVVAVSGNGLGAWSNTIEVTLEALPLVIFNGDKGIEGWDKGGGNISIIDDTTYGKVASLTGDGMNTQYGLYKEKFNQSWVAFDPFVSWDMKYSEDFYIFFYVSDNNNQTYYIRYSPTKPSGKYENYAYINLGAGLMDGNWHHLYRNLQQDLNSQFPGVQIKMVLYSLFRGSGLIDNMTVGPAAQENLGGVLGVIRDSNGNPLANAKVTLLPDNLIYTTEATGKYSFLGLKYGNYQVKVEKETYTFALQNLSIDSPNEKTIDIFASAVIQPPSDIEIFTGDNGLGGWYTGGTATITIQYEDAVRGNVAKLAGNAMSSNYILTLNSSRQYWNLKERYVSWDMNFNEEYVIFLVVDTNQGRYFVRYSPRTLNGKSTNYAYIKLDESTRDGSWQTIKRDVQADLNTQFPTAVISKILYLQVSGSGKIDNVRVLRNAPSLGSVSGYVKDTAGNVLSGAKLTLTPGNQIYTTDGSGYYSFASLPFGNYQLKAEKDNYDFLVENFSITANSPVSLDVNALTNNKPLTIFTGENGTVEGWYTGGTATITIQYEDAIRGNVAVLAGNKMASNYILLNSTKQYWNTVNKYVSWDMNFSEEYVVLLYVNTNQGKYYVRYSPRTLNGQYQNYAYIKLDANTKDGTWHTIVRDVQADLNTQFPDAVISNILYMQANGSGKMDNVLVYREQNLGSVYGLVKDVNGNPLSGILFTLDPGAQIYTTNSTGKFGFASLPFGNYIIRAEKDGMQFSETLKNLSINSVLPYNLEFNELVMTPINNEPLILNLSDLSTTTIDVTASSTDQGSTTVPIESMQISTSTIATNTAESTTSSGTPTEDTTTSTTTESVVTPTPEASNVSAPTNSSAVQSETSNTTTISVATPASNTAEPLVQVSQDSVAASSTAPAN